MKTTKLTSSLCLLAMSVGAALSTQAHAAEDWYKALSDIKASADFRIRYESAEQDNALQDADALTLRTRIGIKTGSYNGFSAVVEMEDNRIMLGQGDYTVGPSGYNPGIYSVIADPEFTELDQGFVQYKNDALTVKVGRQVIALDDHRFVGHVGWRQDRQTFDAATVIYAPSKDLSVQYSYIDQRNRIFGEDADLDAKDHLIHAVYNSRIGKITSFAYLLEVDNDTDNSLDTYGIKLDGNYKADSVKWLYTAQYATQTSDTATTSFDADYFLLEGGAVFSGITAKLGYEVLGSDDGMYGFSTPLATLHKFNGWSDQFLATPAQGLVDMRLSLSTKALGGKWLAVFHQFDTDEDTADVTDLGSEFNIQYTTKIGEHVNAAIKYATYSADDAKVDTDRLWIWFSTKF